MAKRFEREGIEVVNTQDPRQREGYNAVYNKVSRDLIVIETLRYQRGLDRLQPILSKRMENRRWGCPEKGERKLSSGTIPWSKIEQTRRQTAPSGRRLWRGWGSPAATPCKQVWNLRKTCPDLAVWSRNSTILGHLRCKSGLHRLHESLNGNPPDQVRVARPYRYNLCAHYASSGRAVGYRCPLLEGIELPVWEIFTPIYETPRCEKYHHVTKSG